MDGTSNVYDHVHTTIMRLWNIVVRTWPSLTLTVFILYQVTYFTPLTELLVVPAGPIQSWAVTDWGPGPH